MASQVQADLHCHTTASDGLLSPKEVVRLAAEAGLQAVGITDHDTIAGWKEAEVAGTEARLEIVRGIELSAEWDGLEVHILGYELDAESPSLKEHLNGLRTARHRRMLKIIEQLGLLGIRIRAEEVYRIATGESIGRPHLAQVLMDRGYAESIREAFERYLGQGAPAYVPRFKLSPEEGIELVRAAKGVAVLAHPGVGKLDERIPAWVEAGLQGLEVSHSEHGPDEERRCRAIAENLHLVMTGGSDFHGEERKPGVTVGGWGVSMAVVRELKELARVERHP